MSTSRKAFTITTTLAEGEGPLCQLRVTTGAFERTWAVNINNTDNIVKTAVSAIETILTNHLQSSKKQKALRRK